MFALVTLVTSAYPRLLYPSANDEGLSSRSEDRPNSAAAGTMSDLLRPKGLKRIAPRGSPSRPHGVPGSRARMRRVFECRRGAATGRPGNPGYAFPDGE